MSFAGLAGCAEAEPAMSESAASALAIVIPLIFGVWYLVSAKDRYQGPVRTLEEDEVTRDV
mgnify:CR=1 FL=1